MTAGLRRALREAAEAAPPVTVPPGIFDRARRRRRRRTIAAATGALVVLLALVVAGPLWTRPAPAPGVGARPGAVALPATVVVPPGMTADLRHAPVGTALVVYHREGLPGAGGDENQPLAVVGPADRYRVYDRPEWTPSARGQSFLLSPDGRYLLMPNMPSGDVYRTRVLDLSTSTLRTLDEGIPLAWSPDGRQAILVSYQGDASGSTPSAGEIRVLTVPGGEVLRRVALPAGEGDIAAALSPDGAALAVQRGATVTVHDRDGGTATFDAGTAVLAGPAAWTPDGADLLLRKAPGQLVAVAARTGLADPARSYPSVTPDPVPHTTDLPPERVVAWQDGDPVVVVGDRAVWLGVTPRVLVSAPAGSDEMQIATVSLGSAPRAPGPPDPGPFSARYRSVVPWVVTVVLAVAAIVLVLWSRRRRRLIWQWLRI